MVEQQLPRLRELVSFKVQLSESVLSYRGRIRILRVLAESSELNISQLSRRSQMNHTDVDRHVKALLGLGLLRERWYGNVRMVRPAFDELLIRFKRGQGLDLRISNS